MSIVEDRPSLESLMGDPRLEGPFSYAEALRADDAGEPSPDAEQSLLNWGLNAEFVPRSRGGRWGSTRDLVDRLVPVFRRDPGLGLSAGVTTLMSAVNVWCAGSDRQQAAVADRLLAGERVAVAFHELDHGNDFLRNEFRLRLDASEDGRLTGDKALINNIDRAEQVLFMARTADDLGARSHSLVLVGRDCLRAGMPHDRYLTSGMRTVLLGGVRLDGAPLGPDALVGPEGSAVETALRAFQVTRAVLPALAVGSLDAAIHLAVDYAAERSLYGGAVIDLPHARGLLASAYADLVIADGFAGAAVRALHVAPASAGLLTAACKALVPILIDEGLSTLTVLFGSTFYGRVEPYGILEKFVRDLAVLPIGHAGGTSCLLSVLGSLPRWARGTLPAPDPALFDDAACDELDFSALRLGLGAPDPLTPWLTDAWARAALKCVDPALAEIVDSMAASLAELRREVASLAVTSFGAAADDDTFDLARRAALLMAAGAVLGMWSSTAEPATAAPPWLAAGLRKAAARLRLAPLDPPVSVREEAVRHILTAHAGHWSLRLSEEPIHTGGCAQKEKEH